MQRRCPNCNSDNLRRRWRDPEEQPLVRSLYRCGDCHTLFRALSTKMYRRIIFIAALNVVFVAAVIFIG